ncbi:MAG: hypothetical protein AB7H93_14270 [Vicinamibacterales bacterium]
MHTRTRARVVVAALGLAVAGALTATPAAQKPRDPLPGEPLGSGGEAIFPVLEGWGPLKDGSTAILLGYYNRNRGRALDIPVGPDNRIEPGGPDYGQPTHFEPSQQHGVFAIKVPANFGTSRLTWTLKANGQEAKVTFWLNPPYWVDFFKHAATGNEPPVVRFASGGATHTGPPVGFAHTVAGVVGQAVPLSLWVSDVPGPREGPDNELAALRRKTTPVVDPVAIVGDSTFGGPGRRAVPDDSSNLLVHWHKYRGAGAVTFAKARVPVATGGDPAKVVEAATSATFGAPGEYVLRVQISDESGESGGGDQCCWTTAHVKVTVK